MDWNVIDQNILNILTQKKKKAVITYLADLNENVLKQEF